MTCHLLQVVEKELEYTDCARTSHLGPLDPLDPGYTGTCGDLLENDASEQQRPLPLPLYGYFGAQHKQANGEDF